MLLDVVGYYQITPHALYCRRISPIVRIEGTSQIGLQNVDGRELVSGPHLVQLQDAHNRLTGQMQQNSSTRHHRLWTGPNTKHLHLLVKYTMLRYTMSIVNQKYN